MSAVRLAWFCSTFGSRLLSCRAIYAFTVTKIFKVIALLMLALWLPVTQHCALEAAGVELLAKCDHGSSSCEEVCAKDACESFKDTSFSGANFALRTLPPPAQILSACLFFLAPPLLTIDERGLVAAEDPPEVRILHRTWAFARRTALPARAPDLVA